MPRRSPIVANPGAEWHPVAHSPEAALFNARAFLDDLPSTDHHLEPIMRLEGIEESLSMGGTKYQSDHDGRYPFRLTLNGHKHLFEMPGLALDKVRYLEGETASVWNYPRLFIDGSSWIWYIAIRVLMDSEADYR